MAEWKTPQPEQSPLGRADKKHWRNLGRLPRLETEGRCLIKCDGQQIVIFHVDGALFAVNNLCPHEGFPLMEGSLRPDCKLVCNWHCWVFDLKTGTAVVGRDPVRTWPVERRGEDIWIDLTPQPKAERFQAARAEFEEAFEDYDYDRLARALARVRRADGDLEEILKSAFMGKATGLELGFSHPHAALCDWFLLGERLGLDALVEDKSDRAHCALVPALEVLAHLSYDVKTRRLNPLPDGNAQWNAAGFLDALEAQDEAHAMAMIRGAFKEGVPVDTLCDCFSKAALAHLMNLGHPLIFVTKLRRLAERFDAEFVQTLACMLVRYFCLSSRDDLTPEFRTLLPTVENWAHPGGPVEPIPDVTSISGQSVRQLLDLFSRLAAYTEPDDLFEALVGAAALNMVRFKTENADRPDSPVSDTINWLDFTHALTFAQAIREECERQPNLWPAALAQLACFVGRHNRHLDKGLGVDDWLVEDPDAFLQDVKWRILNHDEANHIFAVHWIKTTLAVEDLIVSVKSEEAKTLLYAALNRFLSSRMRTRAPRRSAYQAWSLVRRE